MITRNDIEEYFTYHAPVNDQVERYQRVREAAKAFAEVLVANTPPSADQTAAIRLLREAVMTANASIALEVYEAQKAKDREAKRSQSSEGMLEDLMHRLQSAKRR